MMKKAAWFLLLGVVSIVQAGAQGGVNKSTGKFGATPEDSVQCLRNLSLYREYANQKNYIDALPFWRWVYNNCPLSSKNIFIDGIKIYNFIIDNEKDPSKKDLLIDTLMQVYDRRVELYGEKGYVLGRKGVDLLRYRRSEEKYIQEGFGYLEESIKLLKSKSSAAVFATYFTAAVSLYKLKAIDAPKVVEAWALVLPYVEQAISQNTKDKELPEVRDAIMGNFITSGAATTESLTSYYEPLVNANPEDVKLLKDITSAFTNIGKEDDPLNIKAAELLYAKEPSADAAYKIGKLLVKKEQYQKASKYYTEAIEKETVAETKAKYYFELAQLTAVLNNNSLARTYCFNALELKSGWGEPLILVAKLYAASSASCGADDFEKKTVFWAAVDKAAKAKSIDPNVAEEATNLINQYSVYFPNREEAFFRGFTDGQTYQVGCWIGESTEVRTKK